MFHKVKAVEPLPDYRLRVEFSEGTVKKYDLKPLFGKWDSFQTLLTVSGLFEQVKADTGGYAVAWNDDIDLSADELWHNGSEIYS
jgi:hypothetical protein